MQIPHCLILKVLFSLPLNSPDSSCLVLDWLPGQLVSVPVLTVSGRTTPARTAASDDSHTQEICASVSFKQVQNNTIAGYGLRA